MSQKGYRVHSETQNKLLNQKLIFTSLFHSRQRYSTRSEKSRENRKLIQFLELFF